MVRVVLYFGFILVAVRFEDGFQNVCIPLVCLERSARNVLPGGETYVLVSVNLDNGDVLIFTPRFRVDLEGDLPLRFNRYLSDILRVSTTIRR